MDFFALCNIIFKKIIEETQPILGTCDAAKVTGMGADDTPTKYIDKVAEDIAINTITEERICRQIISEEAGIVSAGGDNGTIFLDPIDGTYNAVMNIPFFAVSIAYGEKGIIKKGFVGNLANGDIFSSERGKGAFLNGIQIHTSSVSVLNECCMSIYGKHNQYDKVTNLVRQIRRFRQFGASALEISYVGAGKIDGFIDLRQNLRATDIAAGILILEEAGGSVTDQNGDPVILPDKVSINNSLIGTNGILHGKVIEYFR